MQWIERDRKERKGKKPGLNKEMQESRRESRYQAVCTEVRQHEIQGNRAGEDNQKHLQTKKFKENHFSKSKQRMNKDKCELNEKNSELKLR